MNNTEKKIRESISKEIESNRIDGTFIRNFEYREGHTDAILLASKIAMGGYNFE